MVQVRRKTAQRNLRTLIILWTSRYAWQFVQELEWVYHRILFRPLWLMSCIVIFCHEHYLSNVTEFRNIKIGIVDSFPYSQKINRITGRKPMRDNQTSRLGIFISSHVCQRDVIFCLLFDDYHLISINFYCPFFRHFNFIYFRRFLTLSVPAAKVVANLCARKGTTKKWHTQIFSMNNEKIVPFG